MWPYLVENKMKIRKLTPKETGDIIQMLHDRVTTAREIHALLKVRLDEAYAIYVKNFKYSLWNPFTFKPVDEQGMIRGMLGKYSSGYSTVSNPKTIQFTNGETFMFVDYSGYDCKFRFDKQHDLDLLSLANYAHRYVLSHDKNRDFAHLLMQYAVRPFELSGDDIIAIENLRSELSRMKTRLEEVKNAIVSSQ